MTQHGSFPGRPRGRRARPGSDAPADQGYDATPEDQREFPDLSPIRPREARPRDSRAPGGQPGQFGQPGQYGGEQYGTEQYGPGHYSGQPSGGQPAGGQYSGDQYSGSYPGGAPGGGQAPWTDQAWPGQAGAEPTARYPAGPAPYPGEPAPGARAAGARSSGARSSGAPSQTLPPQPERPPRRGDDETPSWAEPDSVEAFSERWHRRGLDTRDDRREGRRKRRRWLIAAGLVVALAVGVTVYLLEGGPGAANLGFGSFVTNFLPGELQQVPNPCQTVSSATLSQYMPGQLKEAAPPLNSGKDTECTWTLDSAPTYRVLEVQLDAYSPSGLASGNGSATFAAEDEYQSLENGFLKPGADSGQPKATVTDLSGMPGGTQTSAFQATQVFERGGTTTDVANVLVRYRNVIITVIVDGLDQTSNGKKYGPVSLSDLTAEGNAIAREMATQIAK